MMGTLHLPHVHLLPGPELGSVSPSAGASRSVVSDSATHWTVDSSVRLLCPWNSPGKNTGVGCHSFLQEIFPTQGLSQGLLHYRQLLYQLSHQGSPLGLVSIC